MGEVLVNIDSSAVEMAVVVDSVSNFAMEVVEVDIDDDDDFMSGDDLLGDFLSLLTGSSSSRMSVVDQEVIELRN